MPLSIQQKIYLEDNKKFTPDQIEILENIGMSYDNIIIFQNTMREYLKVNPETYFLNPSLRMINYQMMNEIGDKSEDLLDEEDNLIQEEFDELIDYYNEIIDETDPSELRETNIPLSDSDKHYLSFLNFTPQQIDFFDSIHLSYEDIYRLQCVMRRYKELHPDEPIMNPSLEIVNEEIMNEFGDNSEYLLDDEDIIIIDNFYDLIDNLEEHIYETTQAQRMDRINRHDQIELQNQINNRVRSSVVPETISEFPTCIICAELLNNIDGPGNSRNCLENCNDAIKVCANGHIMHRGCILEACNAGALDMSLQMGNNETGILEQQQRINNCPICQIPLIMRCEQLNIAQAVSDEELKEYKRQTGGKHKGKTKRRKTNKGRKTNKRRKTLRRKTNKRRKTIRRRKT